MAVSGVIPSASVAVLAVCSLTALWVFYPSPAQALSLNDIQTFFHPKAEAAVSSSSAQSVQSMPVLEASMSPNPARGGGDIQVVDGTSLMSDEGPAGTMADISKPKNTQIAIYVVKEGDTLSGIAELFDVSMNTIKWANDISPKGTIRVGQTLTILPVTGVKYTVKKGDTLASVAKQYHGDAAEIANYNNIEGSLVAGSQIVIPNGEIAAPPASKATTKQLAVSGTASYAGYYMRPLALSALTPRTQGVHGYNGVDIAGPVGTPILASAAGEVIVAKDNGAWNGGYGNYVVIKHDNGTQTLYAHQSSVIVGVSQSVVQGQVIGYVGQTGKATGPHVHFEIRGGPRNPF